VPVVVVVVVVVAVEQSLPAPFFLLYDLKNLYKTFVLAMELVVNV